MIIGDHFVKNRVKIEIDIYRVKSCLLKIVRKVSISMSILAMIDIELEKFKLKEVSKFCILFLMTLESTQFLEASGVIVPEPLAN